RAGSPEPIGVGALSVTATAGTRVAERLDPGEEGLVTAPAAYSLGAYTGGDPDVRPLGVDERRCYTNPVWAMPYDVTWTARPSTAGTLAPGELTVDLIFPMSMNSLAGAAELKPLDASGDSTDRATAGSVLTAAWTRANGMRDAHLTLTNRDAIALTGDAYPAA